MTDPARSPVSATTYSVRIYPVSERAERPRLTEYRCPDCNRLLIRARLTPGSAVETYCDARQCRKHHTFMAVDVTM